VDQDIETMLTGLLILTVVIETIRFSYWWDTYGEQKLAPKSDDNCNQADGQPEK